MPAPEHVVELIRHARSRMNGAQDDPNVVPFIGGRQNEVPLDDIGEGQALGLGEFALCNGIRPTHVRCSPAERTRQTNILSGGVMGLTIETHIDDDLQELDQGEWTNCPRTLYDEPDIAAEMRRLGNDFAPPGGESMNDVAARIERCMNKLPALLNPDEPEHVWLHTHGVAIKSYVGKQLGWTHERTYKTPIDNVSRTRFVLRNGIWRLVFLNQPSIVATE